MDNNATLVHASCYFQDEPVKWAKALSELGKSEGYDYIQPTVEMLEDCHTDNKEVMGLLTLLRQPEWQWRSCDNDPNILFFGIPKDEFEVRGYYVTGRNETGAVKVLHEFNDTKGYVVGKTVLKDPRDAYEARELKAKIWKRKKKYFLVLAGRVVDLAKQGFSSEDIRETAGKGYFKRFPAFAVLDGPWTDKEQAVAAKASL